MYEVLLQKAATKALAALDKSTYSRVMAVLLKLEKEPYPPGYKKLKGYEGLCRVRVGDYRIIYEVIGGELIIYVLKIGHRKDVYK